MTTREARTLLASDCPRLDSELAILRAMAHTTKADLRRRKAEHRAWHPCPRDYDPGYLPRDPERKP